jgi:hypothetical protein
MSPSQDYGTKFLYFIPRSSTSSINMRKGIVFNCLILGDIAVVRDFKEIDIKNKY